MNTRQKEILRFVGRSAGVLSLFALTTALPWWVAERLGDPIAVVTPTPTPSPEVSRKYICDCGRNSQGDFWAGRKFETSPNIGMGYYTVGTYLGFARSISNEEFYQNFPPEAVVGNSTVYGGWVRPRNLATR